MRFVIVLSLALSTWAARPARAQEQADPNARIAQLRAMMADARFEDAVGEARAILALTNLAAAQRNATLESLAIAQLAQRDQRGARETLVLLYSRDPDHRLLDRDASPQVQAAFDRARESHPAPVSVTIERASPERLPQRAAPVLQVRLTAGADAVNELRLSYRQGESRTHASEAQVGVQVGDFERVTMAHNATLATAQARIPLLDGDAAYDVDWYVEALAPSQAVVGRLGDALEPLSLSLPRAAARAVEVLHVADPNARRDEGGGSILGEWWFWTAVGVVVLGGATAAYLLTRPSGQGCTETIGCDTLPPASP